MGIHLVNVNDIGNFRNLELDEITFIEELLCKWLPNNLHRLFIFKTSIDSNNMKYTDICKGFHTCIGGRLTIMKEMVLF